MNRGRMQHKMNIERRKKWLRRMWWNAKEDVDFMLWIVMILIGGITLWLVYGLWPRG